MARVRWHRGSLQDSLATTVTMNSRRDLLDSLNGDFWDVVDEDISIKPYGGDDARCGWRDVHMITVQGQCVGFCEGPLS